MRGSTGKIKLKYLSLLDSPPPPRLITLLSLSLPLTQTKKLIFLQVHAHTCRRAHAHEHSSGRVSCTSTAIQSLHVEHVRDRLHQSCGLKKDMQVGEGSSHHAQEMLRSCSQNMICTIYHERHVVCFHRSCPRKHI